MIKYKINKTSISFTRYKEILVCAKFTFHPDLSFYYCYFIEYTLTYKNRYKLGISNDDY